ncbi:DUF4296 domain-containing protein [Mangrovimonas aestuarii]|uniref:DUF4296 domain-containing protein n=1 Tax=Mangrovimonas aestuarii TaxID=3018443 RepID=UPI002379F809|nr:DUF4296 domain-containing protein [Mangrovimonas aestuarii]
MKKLVVIFGLALLFLSCNYVYKPEKPKKLLSKKEMSYILMDLAFINSAKGVNNKALEEHGLNPKDYVYEKYAIDSVIFAENNNYYAYDFDAYAEIYTMVEDSLEKLSEVYVKKEEEEKEATRIQDSLGEKAQDSIRVLKRKKPFLKEKFNKEEIKSITYPKKPE